METRSAELRRRHRRVLRWSFGIAVLFHAVVLIFVPWYRAEPLAGGGTELVGPRVPAWGSVAVDAFFGPPAIVRADGAAAREPDTRVLRASRLVPPPAGCEAHDWLAREEAGGEVRLEVDATGRVSSVEVTAGTGDRCWDEVLRGLASDLLYRWLPSERFPAPVELYQPLTLTPARR